MSTRGPGVQQSRGYFPQDSQIQVHQMRVTPCPQEFPAGYYWYGTKRHGPGYPPKWVDKLLNDEEVENVNDAGKEQSGGA